jgi:hypothetical protein
MALKLSETSCIFRQIPLTGMNNRTFARAMRAANDNDLHRQPIESRVAEESPSLADIGPIMALMAVSAGTFYAISTVLLGYVRSFPLFYP